MIRATWLACSEIRILTIIDTFSRYAPAIYVKQSYREMDVVEMLDRVARQVGYPKAIRLDNGPEFVSKELDLWAYLRA